MEDDARVASVPGQPELELGIERRRVREEVDGPVLEALVDRQQQQRPVRRPVLVEQTVKSRPLAELL